MIEYLLITPTETITREHREQIMSILLRKLDGLGSKLALANGEDDDKRIISLMVKLMKKPTFYPVRTGQPPPPKLLAWS